MVESGPARVRKPSFGERVAAALTGKATPPPTPPPVPRLPSSGSFGAVGSVLSSVPLRPAPPIPPSMPPRASSHHLRAPSQSRFTVAPPLDAPLLPSASVDTSKLPSLEFFHLTHIPESVSSQVESGLYTVHRMIRVLRGSLSSEEEYWRAHIKTMEHESQKWSRLSRDHMWRARAAWTSWQCLQIDLAHRHLASHTSTQLHVLVPLLEFHSAATSKKKEVDREFASREKECHAARITLKKEQQACEKLIDVWKTLDQEENGTSGAANRPSSLSAARSSPFSSSSSSHGRPSLLNKLTRAVSTLSYSSSTAVQEKLVVASIKYSEALAAYNRRLDLFHTRDLPQYLLELQRLELQRLDVVSTVIHAHAQIAAERAQALANDFYANALPANAATLDAAADVEDTISLWTDAHGFAPVHAPHPYALPVSLEEIRAGRIGGARNSVFHVSLAHLMSAQSSTHPSLPLPRFLLLVIDAIRSSANGRGVEQEGIFRISPSKDEMDALKRVLDTVGVGGLTRNTIPTSNVHLACALLKEWLRSLADAVIPTKMYQECINIVKKALAADEPTANATSSTGTTPLGRTPPATPSSSAGVTGGAALSSPPPAGLRSSATSSHLTSFVASLPAVNQRVLQVIADFVAEVVSEEHQKHNRMTIDNLSIVLAPCLLRSTSEDPQEMIMVQRLTREDTRHARARVRSNDVTS